MQSDPKDPDFHEAYPAFPIYCTESSYVLYREEPTGVARIAHFCVSVRLWVVATTCSNITSGQAVCSECGEIDPEYLSTLRGLVNL